MWVTTSGHFSTHMLKYVVDEFGADRVLFSVDSRTRRLRIARRGLMTGRNRCRKAVGGEDNYRKFRRDNARALLRLSGFHDENVEQEVWCWI